MPCFRRPFPEEISVFVGKETQTGIEVFSAAELRKILDAATPKLATPGVNALAPL